VATNDSNAENPKAVKPNDDSKYQTKEDASNKEIWLYAFGNIENAWANKFYMLMNSIMVISLGISPVISGMLVGIKSFWDGITDPVMAQITDNANTRWGRRRPFILIGGVGRLSFLLLVFLFFPRENLNLEPNTLIQARKKVEDFVKRPDKVLGEHKAVAQRLQLILDEEMNQQTLENVFKQRARTERVAELLHKKSDKKINEFKDSLYLFYNKNVFYNDEFISVDSAAQASALYDSISSNIDAIDSALQVTYQDREQRKRENFKLGKKKTTTDKIKAGWATFVDPQFAPKRAMVIYMLIAFLIFTTLTTVNSVPYYALGIEICQSYNGRTKVATYRSVMDKIAGFFNPFVLPFCYLTIFTDVLEGLRWFGIFVAAIGIPSTVLMVIFTKERKQISTVKKKYNIFHSMFLTIKNVHFLKILFLYSFFGFSIGIFSQIGMYLNVYWVFDGDKLAGTFMGSKVQAVGWAIAFGTLPVVKWMCDKFQKHNTLRIAILIMAVGSLLKWWLVNPEHPEYQYVIPLFFSLGISSLYTVLGTMMADVTDIDELNTGQRREGMFGASMAFLMKIIESLKPVMTGVVLALSGYSHSYGVHQPDEVILRMRVLYSLVPGALCLLGMLILYKYPLTRERMEEVKTIIQRRKEEASKAEEEAAKQGGGENKSE